MLAFLADGSGQYFARQGNDTYLNFLPNVDKIITHYRAHFKLACIRMMYALPTLNPYFCNAAHTFSLEIGRLSTRTPIAL